MIDVKPLSSIASNMPYLHRTIEKEIPNLCQNFKVLLMTGLRQVGKSTTFAYLSSENRAHVTLDNQVDRDTALYSPGVFFSQHPLPIFIDEIQLVPELFRQVKCEVDKNDLFGQVWLTGSQRFSLMKSAGESLFGRLCEIHLMPLSLYERKGVGLLQQPYIPQQIPANHLSMCTEEEVWEIIWQGAWPRVYDTSPTARDQFFTSLISTFLEKDIRSLENVDKLRAFRKFMFALAFRTGQELRINKLCEIAGVTAPTVTRWLSIAEASGLIFLLPAFSHDSSKTLTKSPKIYFTDTGLASYLCDISTPKELARHTLAGAFFETFVVTEILKSWRHNGLEPKLYYYREAKTGAEIDLVLHHMGQFHPIEIKCSPNPHKSMIKNFKELEKFPIKVGYGAVICTASETRYLDYNVAAHSFLRL